MGRLASRQSLRGVNLVRADLAEIVLAGADLTDANLRMADLNKADLREVRLAGAHLSGAMLKEANLVGANLVEASMIGVTLKGADLSRADMSGADLTGANLDAARLVGTYLVGAYLNETSLNGSDLSGAYIRMAQMGGSRLTGATLDGADLSHADLSAVHLDRSSMIGANLEGTSLPGSYLTGCDLRGVNLTGADLTGCNLTGARVSGVTFERVKLDDAWADWIDLSEDGSGNRRASLEEAFTAIIGKPLAEILIDDQVTEFVWAELIGHLAEFQFAHPKQSDIRLRSINQGVSSSAIYIEADSELSLAAYLADLADIIGKGSVELFQRLAIVVGDPYPVSVRASQAGSSNGDSGVTSTAPQVSNAAGPIVTPEGGATLGAAIALASGSPAPRSRSERLEGTAFWHSDKAFAVLTGDRRIWLEASSSDALSLRPPHGIVRGVDLIRGKFAAESPRRSQGISLPSGADPSPDTPPASDDPPSEPTD